jgi:hypothetical protein
MQVRPMLQAEALTRLLQGAVLGAIFVMHEVKSFSRGITAFHVLDLGTTTIPQAVRRFSMAGA